MALGANVCNDQPQFRLEVEGNNTFTNENWLRGILLRRQATNSRGSGIVWERNTTGNQSLNYFIAGPQNNDGVWQGDFFTGVYSGHSHGNARTHYVSRIDGNMAFVSGNGVHPVFPEISPRFAHTQYFRDMYFWRQNGTITHNGQQVQFPFPRLGINVNPLGGDADQMRSLEVRCAGDDPGTVRFSCLDTEIAATRLIGANDDGDLTYVDMEDVGGGINNGCQTMGRLPMVADTDGNLVCSVVQQGGYGWDNVGINMPPSDLPVHRLSVDEGIWAGTFVEAQQGHGFRLGGQNNNNAEGQVVLDHPENGSLGVGFNAGRVAGFNTNIGDRAGQNMGDAAAASGNVAVGVLALNAVANPGMAIRNNTAVGFEAGRNIQGTSFPGNPLAPGNALLGYQSGLNVANGTGNALMGHRSGSAIQGGWNNTYIGSFAGAQTVDGANNVAIGASSGPNSQGQNITNTGCFGANAEVTMANTQRFGDGAVLRWGFGVDPADATRIMSVRLPGSDQSCGGPCTLAFMNTGGVWNSISDVNMKTGIKPVDHEATLQKVLELPITEWSYIEDPSVRHLGPMAQDFHAAFRLGHGETTISTVDPTGVALSAIKGLATRVEDQAELLVEQMDEMEELRQRVKELEEALAGCCAQYKGPAASQTAGQQDAPRLDQNRPNPFQERSLISYYVPASAKQAQLRVYSMGGEEVHAYRLAIGQGEVIIEGGTLAPGTYVYTLLIDDRQFDSKLMVVTR